MKVCERLSNILVALALAVLLFVSISKADENITAASASAFVFSNQKDGKRDIICKRTPGGFEAGAASYDKKKKRWSWRSYQTDLEKIAKPGKKIKQQNVAKLRALFDKIALAENYCEAVEAPRILGSWSRQYDCSDSIFLPCLETYTYTFNSNGTFLLSMEGVSTCQEIGGEQAKSVFYLGGFYSYDGQKIILSRFAISSAYSACPDRPAYSGERFVSGTDFGRAIVSTDGKTLDMDLFCPEDLKSKKELFFCQTPLSANFIRD
jgi:hypothetical protein